MPEARHRDAWAEEQKAPTRTAYLAEQAASNASPASPEAPRLPREASNTPEPDPGRTARIVGATAKNPSTESDDEILVVVSKLKKYIRDQSGMNTSDGAMGPISDHLRTLCRDAIRHANEEGRKTVMDRDFLPFLHRR